MFEFIIIELRNSCTFYFQNNVTDQCSIVLRMFNYLIDWLPMAIHRVN